MLVELLTMSQPMVAAMHEGLMGQLGGAGRHQNLLSLLLEAHS